LKQRKVKREKERTRIDPLSLICISPLSA